MQYDALPVFVGPISVRSGCIIDRSSAAHRLCTTAMHPCALLVCLLLYVPKIQIEYGNEKTLTPLRSCTRFGMHSSRGRLPPVPLLTPICSSGNNDGLHITYSANRLIPSVHPPFCPHARSNSSMIIS